MTDNPTCKTCPWHYVEIDDKHMMTVSECHKSAPAEGYWSFGTYQACWPTVQPDDWCGDHPERKREADHA